MLIIIALAVIIYSFATALHQGPARFLAFFFEFAVVLALLLVILRWVRAYRR